jgi:hypothetical protein
LLFWIQNVFKAVISRYGKMKNLRRETFLTVFSRGDSTGEKMEIKTQPIYYVVFCMTKYASFEDAKTNAAEDIAAQIKR